MTGDFAPSGGTIGIGDRDVSTAPARIRPSLGVARTHQKALLFPGLTVANDLFVAIVGKEASNLRCFNRSSDSDFRDRAARHQRRRLSYGEQRQPEVGMALSTNPSLLMLDQPSERLAPTIVDKLIDVSKVHVEEGHAILLVEQNLHVANKIAERQLIMVSGRIEVEQTAEQLDGDHDTPRRYLGVDTLLEESA